MEQTLAEISKNSSLVSLQGEIGGLDWLAVAADFTLEMLFNGSQQSKKSQSVPLLSAIYRDSVVCFSGVSYFDKTFFLKALLRLNPPYLALPTGIIDGASKEMLTTLRPQVAILCPLHALTFPAFLTAHEFLTPDFLVEEAHYSDKTYVLINQSETELYETGELLLPPGGFYVRHPQFEAHDALRVRTVEFSKRAWRVRRSLDGKPLESSGSIEEREFEVSPP